MATELRLLSSGVDWREVEGRIVVLAPAGNEIVVNRAGALLWPLLVAGADREQLQARLVERFGIDPDQAEQDVEAFVTVLRSRGLLEA